MLLSFSSLGNASKLFIGRRNEAVLSICLFIKNISFLQTQYYKVAKFYLNFAKAVFYKIANIIKLSSYQIKYVIHLIFYVKTNQNY